MKISFAIGNGESRQGFDISPCRDVGPVYACNYIYQDYHVDNLIACDKHVAKEIVASGYNTKCNFYTRERCYSSLGQPEFTKVLPTIKFETSTKWKQSINWGSGLYAVYLACEQQADMVVMLGFDLNGFNETENNNVYKQLRIPGTSATKNKPVDASFWIKQFALLFHEYPDVTFSFINRDDWQYPNEWESYDNWTIDNYTVLEQFIKDNRF